MRSRERPVACVVPGNRHDRAGAVATEHVRSRPHRKARAGQRMDRVRPELHADREVGLGRRRWELVAPRVDLAHPIRGHEVLELRVIGADDEERRAEERVRTRGVHGDVLAPAALEVEEDGRAFAAPDPVALHRLRRLRPVERVERIEQLLRVAGDLDPPLAEIPRLHDGVAALAPALLHLLVGEHGEARRAPVDCALAPLDEPGVEEPHEEPLRPAVVRRGRRC